MLSAAFALEVCVSGSKISEAATRFPSAVASAGDQDPAIGERGGGVTVRGTARLSSCLTCSELEALTHVAIASITTAPRSAKKWPRMLLALGVVCIGVVLSRAVLLEAIR